MWVSKDWKDYKILDCGDGEKVEFWGKYSLVRPDPQAIWRKSDNNKHWNKSDAVYNRSSTGGGKWKINKLPQSWKISYKELTFNIKPMNFKHTGLFPEQASNWDFIMDSIKGANREISVLNLFAYTGGATLAAAKAGAKVCHVDASKGMVSHAKENAVASGLEKAPIRWIVDDCKKFIEREIRRGNKYDAIIMDPPSYGRGPTGEIWKIEDDIADFLELSAKLLSDTPLFMIVNSYSTGLSPSTMGYMLGSTVLKKHKGTIESDELGLLVESTGFALPCGNTTRFIAK